MDQIKPLLEKDGTLINGAELKDQSTGSHFFVQIVDEQVIVKVFKYGSCGRPSIPIRLLLPGENRLETAGGVRLLLQLPEGLLPTRPSVQFSVINSPGLISHSIFENMMGDLLEEYTKLKFKHGIIKAGLWYWKQVSTSAWSFLKKR